MFQGIMSEDHLKEVWGFDSDFVRACTRITRLEADLEKANSQIVQLKKELENAKT